MILRYFCWGRRIRTGIAAKSNDLPFKVDFNSYKTIPNKSCPECYCTTTNFEEIGQWTDVKCLHPRRSICEEGSMGSIDNSWRTLSLWTRYGRDHPLPIQYMKIPSSEHGENMKRTSCAHKSFFVLTFRTTHVNNMFFPCSLHVLNLEFSCTEMVIHWTIFCHILG